MPDRDNFQPRSAHTVVNPVANSIDMKTPDVSRVGSGYLSSHARLLDEKGECRLKVFTNRAGRCRPMDGPPPGNAIDLFCSAARDEQFERHGYS